MKPMHTPLLRALHNGLTAAAAAALFVSLPASSDSGNSLYAQVGGAPAVAKVVDSFIEIVAADVRINAAFANANIPRLKLLLNEQVCGALGGPCTYSGRDMKSSHAGMGITQAQFNALAEDLYAAMSRHGVPYATQNKLMALLAPMHRDIVER
mgnify:CR=1 FL=1